MFRTAVLAVTGVCLTSAGHGVGAQDAREPEQQLDGPRHASALTTKLVPTNHPPLPGHPSHFWFAPDVQAARGSARGSAESPIVRFGRGVKFFNDGEYAAALPLVSAPELASTPLADYARYYTGFVQARLNRIEEADKIFDELQARTLVGYLAEAVSLREAEIELEKNDPADALRTLEALSREKTTAPEDVLMRIGAAAEAAGNTDKALAAYRRVYYEFPVSEDAEVAGEAIRRLAGGALVTPERFKLDLGRAERLFASRRYEPARDAFAALARLASGDDKELVTLRLAECDYFLKKFRASRDALRPYLTGASREAEARFFHLTATRALGEREAYVALARGLANDFPQESWTEEALNNLASHYIVENDDAEADRVFRELYRRFSKGRHAERAAWKIGWWAYKNGEHAETVRVFEEAAAASPRADTRPAWLYWSARAHDQLGNESVANDRYRLVATDYLNSYYGRLAAKHLASRKAPPVEPVVTTGASSTPPPTEVIIRRLVGLELYDEAIKELQYAQRTWGDSPAIQATTAWVRYQQGLAASSFTRFERMRGAMNTMKRAYPQYLAAGGEDLPPELLRVLFPVDYWALIKKYSDAHGLDPYVIAALIAQESTFTADIRSAANAYGLMQLIPGTGRRYARSIGIRRFSTATLTHPESNIRIGTAYFKELVGRFGGAHFALASYNAGEHRIARWISERPGVAQDEFIDDIPFPETQNYVKKILGTAEDYRRLYGGGILTPPGAPAASSVKTPPAQKPAAKKPAKKQPAPRRRK
jgi:soluble lytic murein transglycosylase